MVDETPSLPEVGTQYDPSSTVDWTQWGGGQNGWFVVFPGSRQIFGHVPLNMARPNPAVPGKSFLETKFPGKEYYVSYVYEEGVELGANQSGIEHWPYWLSYDWGISEEPVNQIPYLEGYYSTFVSTDSPDRPAPGKYIKGYYEHVCGFAHNLSLTPSHLSQHLDHSNLEPRPLDPHGDDSNLRWQLMWRYSRAAVGFVFNQLERWERRPAETDASWSTRRVSHIENLMKWLCWQCDHPYWASKLLIGMNTTTVAAAVTPVLVRTIQTPHGPYKIHDVKLPRLDPETLAPMTGSTDFFASTRTPLDPNAVWRTWTSGYKKALLRYYDRYAQRAA